MGTADTVAILPGISAIADRYDGYIIDLWGVVHDGIAPYHGVVDCMRRLRAAGRRIILLSNAPRSGSAIRGFLTSIGVPDDAYDDIVTSGDLTRAALADRTDRWHATLGRAVYYLGKTADAAVLNGLDYHLVEDPADADFVLNLGLADADTETVEDYLPGLEVACRRGLKMICGNPDLTVMRGSTMLFCAGALAQAYAERGGDVVWHGKPHAGAYQACFKRFDGFAPGQIVGVGDSFRTDIAGARAAGIASLFVLGGIHADEAGITAGGALDPHSITRMCSEHGQRPDAVIARFNW